MSLNPPRVGFQLTFQISPIILTGGIAKQLGGALPIVALTESALFGAAAAANTLRSGGISGLLNSAFASTTLDKFFANYKPVPGGKIINNLTALYPFANQSVAANAVIFQPLPISMMMTCPAGDSTGGYLGKAIIMQSLQASLTQHIIAGGLFTVITPVFIWPNCVLTGMTDVTGGASAQVQYEWQLDFSQPLVTAQQAQKAQNGLMQTITNGTPITSTPSWSVAGLGVGNPFNMVANSLVPPGVQ